MDGLTFTDRRREDWQRIERQRIGLSTPQPSTSRSSLDGSEHSTYKDPPSYRVRIDETRPRVIKYPSIPIGETLGAYRRISRSPPHQAIDNGKPSLPPLRTVSEIYDHNTSKFIDPVIGTRRRCFKPTDDSKHISSRTPASPKGANIRSFNLQASRIIPNK